MLRLEADIAGDRDIPCAPLGLASETTQTQRDRIGILEQIPGGLA
jgi:hypothetical protein